MEHLVEKLKSDNKLFVHIRGHVCCGPGEKISTKRAKKVYNFLKGQGVPVERMSYKGYSNEVPLIWPEKTRDAEASNRRVDFILTRKD